MGHRLAPAHSGAVDLRIGEGLTLREGGDVTLVATGSMVGRSLVAADLLSGRGISARVLEIHTIKPLDVELILGAAEATGAIVTAEEHSVIGGLGGAVAEALCSAYLAPLERVGIDDRFTCTAPDSDTLMDAYGLAVEDIVAAAERSLARKRS